MGHGLKLLAALATCALCACARDRVVPDQARVYRQASVRAEAMAYYVGRDIADSALYELPMIYDTRSATTMLTHQAPLYVPEPVAAAMVKGARLGDVLAMWGRTWGYTPVFADTASQSLRLLSSWKGDGSASVLSDWLMNQTGQRVTVFPESRLLLVTGG